MGLSELLGTPSDRHTCVCISGRGVNVRFSENWDFQLKIQKICSFALLPRIGDTKRKRKWIASVRLSFG